MEIRSIVAGVVGLTVSFAAVAEAHAQAASAVFQQQAELDLREIDCDISRLTNEMNKLQGHLYDVIERQVGQLKERDEFMDAKIVEWKKELAAKIPEVEYESFAVDKSRKFLGNSLQNIAKKGTVILSIVDDWGTVIEKLHSELQRREMQATIDRTSQDFKDLRRQIAATAQAIKTSFKLHDTTVKIWESKGVVLQRNFYGLQRDCAQQSNQFDGLWKTRHQEKPDLEIRGTAARILHTMQVVDGVECDNRMGEFVYLDQDNAEVRWHTICGAQGVGMTGIIKMKKTGKKIERMWCAVERNDSVDCADAAFVSVSKAGD
jgi:hypothetical protein